MDKVLPKREPKELALLKSKLMTMEDLGYVNGVSQYSCDEEALVKFLVEREYSYKNAIDLLHKYLLGYLVGEATLENTSDKSSLSLNIDDLPLSPIKEVKSAKELFEEMMEKEQKFLSNMDDLFGDKDYFYILGRLDAFTLGKNNSKYYAMLIINSKSYKEAVTAIREYLKGFDYEMQVISYKKEHPEYIEDDTSPLGPEIEAIPPLCFQGEAEYILERCL